MEAIRKGSKDIVIHRVISSLRKMRMALPSSTTIGFVPTMGALHDGHLSLVKEARMKNDVVIASIFVNPTQFGVGEDLDKYPRQLEQDSQCLFDLGVDHIFAPNNDIMYGKHHVTYVDPTGFDDIPEGKSRPGHFRGVATIVTKLFNIVQPTTAYFGQKDAAQCVLIKRIVDDLNMPIEIQVMDTIRENDGLAMSSRNTFLQPNDERKAAPVIYASLQAAKKLYQERVNNANDLSRSLSIPVNDLIKKVKDVLQSEPLISEILYISVDDRETMQPLFEVNSSGAIISLACKIGSVRLIDNIILS